MKSEINKLKNNVMFHLSLSDKELFHSNFLAWILSSDFPLVATRRLLKLPAAGTLDVEREKKNLDLTIALDSKTLLVVENKIKSLPTRKQLEDYSGKVSADVRKLLLAPQMFIEVCAEEIPSDWGTLAYEDLASALKKDAEKFGKNLAFVRELVLRYSEFVTAYCGILDSLKKFGEAPFFFPKKSREALDEIRLGGVCEKLRFAVLRATLKNTLKPAPTEKDLYADCFGRGSGRLDFFFTDDAKPNSKGRIVGIQMQDGQLRVGVNPVTADKTAWASERIRGIFAKCGWTEDVKGKPSGYNNGGGKYFRYHYVKLEEDESCDSVVAKMNKVMKVLKDEAQEILRVL